VTGAWDRTDPRGAIAAAASAHSNWGRWGEDDDVLGTVNFIDQAKRRQAAGLIRRGDTFSLAIEFAPSGPQRGENGRTNPIWTVRAMEVRDAGDVPFPTHGGGGVDDMVVIPLQCATQWDAPGHLKATIAAQGATSAVGRGDIVLVRTGQLARSRRQGWGTYSGGDAPGLSLETVAGCTPRRSRPSRPIPGASRCGRTSSTSPLSSPCTRWSSRISAC
jgi:hypothetical protein